MRSILSSEGGLSQRRITNPGYWETGVQACTRLIAVRSGKARAGSYAARSAWQRRLKKYDEALADIDRALSLEPTNVTFYDAGADIWRAKGDLDRAIANYDQAIRMDPTYAAAYVSRGDAYKDKGDVERARASYYAALATPKTRANDGTGLQQWAHQTAEERLQKMNAETPAR
jgi:tetratricopeptide (TPR) repeat protein